MDQNITQPKKADDLCRAGCIVTIILSGSIMLVFLIFSILSFISSAALFNGVYAIIAAVMYLFFAAFQIAPLIMAIKVLKGSAQSNLAAGILALIFSGLIGGILILVGKYQVSQQPEQVMYR